VSGWWAGAATATVPVPNGTPLAGYAARSGPTEGTRDDLTVSALVLEPGERRFALIAVDLIAVDFSLVEAIAARTGLPVESIALCASHTHSGPSGVTDRLHPAQQEPINAALRDAFVAAGADVVCRAGASLVEATVSFGRTTVTGIAANRLDPDGPFDPTVFVLKAQGLDGESIATVVNFACHPTILPAESRVVSADFPGALRRHLDPAQHGVVLYTNGAAGDISTRFTRYSQDGVEIERVGTALADAVTSLADFEELRPALAFSHTSVGLPFWTIDQLRSRFDAAPRPDGDQSDRVEVTRRQGLAILEGMMRGSDIDRYEAHIGLWRIGELTLIGMPGELFASLGRALIANHPERVMLGYTNGYAGYFPDDAAYGAGTYEALASPYESETVATLMETIGRLL